MVKATVIKPVFVFPVPDLSELSIALELFGKCSFTTAANLLYFYTTEVYPTAVRTTACGLCSTVSRIGTCIVPFLFQLGEPQAPSQQPFLSMSLFVWTI